MSCLAERVRGVQRLGVTAEVVTAQSRCFARPHKP